MFGCVLIRTSSRRYFWFVFFIHAYYGQWQQWKAEFTKHKTYTNTGKSVVVILRHTAWMHIPNHCRSTGLDLCFHIGVWSEPCPDPQWRFYYFIFHDDVSSFYVHNTTLRSFIKSRTSHERWTWIRLFIVEIPMINTSFISGYFVAFISLFFDQLVVDKASSYCRDVLPHDWLTSDGVSRRCSVMSRWKARRKPLLMITFKPLEFVSIFIKSS